MIDDPPFVTVIWGDAFSQPANQYVSLKEAKKIHKPLKSETKGYLIYRDIVGITIMGERQEDHTDGGNYLYRNHTFIPAGMIIAIRHARKRPKKAPQKVAPASKPDHTPKSAKSSKDLRVSEDRGLEPPDCEVMDPDCCPGEISRKP